MFQELTTQISQIIITLLRPIPCSSVFLAFATDSNPPCRSPIPHCHTCHQYAPRTGNHHGAPWHEDHNGGQDEQSILSRNGGEKGKGKHWLFSALSHFSPPPPLLPSFILPAQFPLRIMRMGGLKTANCLVFSYVFTRSSRYIVQDVKQWLGNENRNRTNLLYQPFWAHGPITPSPREIGSPHHPPLPHPSIFPPLSSPLPDITVRHLICNRNDSCPAQFVSN